jgi:hypothetical protein
MSNLNLINIEKINNLLEIEDDRYVYFFNVINSNIFMASGEIAENKQIINQYNNTLYNTLFLSYYSLVNNIWLKFKFIKLSNGQYNIKIVNDFREGKKDLYVASLISENNDGDFHNEWIYIKNKTGLDTSKWTIDWNIEVVSSNPLIVQLTTATKCMNAWKNHFNDLTVISKERCSANIENKIKFYIFKAGDFIQNRDISWNEKVKGNALFKMSDSISCSEVTDRLNLNKCSIGNDNTDSGGGIGAVVGNNNNNILVSTIKNYLELSGEKYKLIQEPSSKTEETNYGIFTVKCDDNSFLTGDTETDPNQKFKGAICSKAQIKKGNNVILELKKIANSDINGWGECNKQNQLVTRMSIYNNAYILGMTCSEFTEVGPYIDFQNYIKTISDEYNTNKLVNNPAKLDELRNFCSGLPYNKDSDIYKKIGSDIQNAYKINKYDTEDKYKDTCKDLIRYIQCYKRKLPNDCSQKDIEILEKQCDMLGLTRDSEYNVKDNCNKINVKPKLEQCKTYGIPLNECSKVAITSKMNALSIGLQNESVKILKSGSKDESAQALEISDALQQNIKKLENIQDDNIIVKPIVTTSYMLIGLIVTGVGIVLLGILFLL